MSTTYTIWTDINHSEYTRVTGVDPLVDAAGKPLPSCHYLLHTFTAKSKYEAKSLFSKFVEAQGRLYEISS